ncbi:MAG: hypothetical protein Q8R81_01860 [Novosphingobium sp.]|nr:hypothetical protein [Novosphingobium sp.]MDP3549123.1 hypothetical protein [Novosphingobium sp.]
MTIITVPNRIRSTRRVPGEALLIAALVLGASINALHIVLG